MKEAEGHKKIHVQSSCLLTQRQTKSDISLRLTMRHSHRHILDRSILQRCDVVSLGIRLPVFRDSILVLSARVKMSMGNNYCSWTVANLRRTDASSTPLQKPENLHDI